MEQEDAWAVVSAYFEQKGLVRQQLDSFDEFIQNTMQELVDENSTVVVQMPSHHPGIQGEVTVRSQAKPNRHACYESANLLMARSATRSILAKFI